MSQQTEGKSMLPPACCKATCGSQLLYTKPVPNSLLLCCYLLVSCCCLRLRINLIVLRNTRCKCPSVDIKKLVLVLDLFISEARHSDPPILEVQSWSSEAAIESYQSVVWVKIVPSLPGGHSRNQKESYGQSNPFPNQKLLARIVIAILRIVCEI